MNWFQRLIRKEQLENDLQKEIADHIEWQVSDYRHAGFTEEEARRKTRLTFHHGLIKETVREEWGIAELDRFWQDIRYAARSFRKNPNFALAVIFSLALGLGGTCAFFSVIYAVVIHPMYRDVNRIIIPTFSEPDTGGRRPPFDYTITDFLHSTRGSILSRA